MLRDSNKTLKQAYRVVIFSYSQMQRY